MNARKLAALALLALVPCMSACSSRSKPTAPPACTSPVLIATAPTARATGVLYDTDIWAQFDRPLDRTSVDTTTVFLKRDTQRQPIIVTYDPSSRRIFIRPRKTLDLLTTYTVEFSARIRADGGDEIGQQLFWQFSTNSLRRMQLDIPSRGALVSPFSLLGWSGNGAPTNTRLYEVYASTDSLAVVNRTVPYVYRSTLVAWFPRMRWAAGVRTYWSVTAVSLVTGERLAGPVSSFDVLPADAPVDSLNIDAQDYSAFQQGQRFSECNRATFSLGPNYNSALRYPLTGGQPGLRVADAYISMTSDAPLTAGTVTVWLAQNPWVGCSTGFPGPPYADPDGQIAAGESVAGTNSAIIRGDGLAAYVEAALRYGNWYGLLVRSAASYAITGNPTPPLLHVVFYRASVPISRAARR